MELSPPDHPHHQQPNEEIGGRHPRRRDFSPSTGNRNALETLVHYFPEQGLAAKRLTVEEMFESSTLVLVEQGSFRAK